jgi:hypothetical protein
MAFYVLASASVTSKQKVGSWNIEVGRLLERPKAEKRKVES